MGEVGGHEINTRYKDGDFHLQLDNIEIDNDNGNVHVSSNVAGRALEEEDLPEIQINNASLSGQVGGHEINTRYKDGDFHLQLDNIEIEDDNGNVHVSSNVARRALEEEDLPEIQINSASVSGEAGVHEINARYEDGDFHLQLDNIEIDNDNGDV